MPAALAKGVILLSSILVAAGIAAYENPEVRAWVQERRRRIALAYNEFIDELDRPRPPPRRRTWHEDASMREDPSPEAAERRRKARQQIAEKGILLEQQRRATLERQGSASTFDEMVDDSGKLLEKPSQPISTALEDKTGNVLRNRSANTNAIIEGSNVANPFDDEIGGIINEKSMIENERQAPIQAIAPSSTAPRLQIATTLAPATSVQNEAGETQLTPTTSMAPSTLLSDTGVMTPTSANDMVPNNQGLLHQSQVVPTQSYQSIQEWASAASSGPESFYSPPESERNFQILDTNVIHTPSNVSSRTASLIGTNDGASEGGDLGVEALSDSGADTPYTWSEIGSQVSNDD